MAVRTGTSVLLEAQPMSEVKSALPENRVAARRVDIFGAVLMPDTVGNM